MEPLRCCVLDRPVKPDDDAECEIERGWKTVILTLPAVA